jgi:hypothetical protein
MKTLISTLVAVLISQVVCDPSTEQKGYYLGLLCKHSPHRLAGIGSVIFEKLVRVTQVTLDELISKSLLKGLHLRELICNYNRGVNLTSVGQGREMTHRALVSIQVVRSKLFRRIRDEAEVEQIERCIAYYRLKIQVAGNDERRPNRQRHTGSNRKYYALYPPFFKEALHGSSGMHLRSVQVNAEAAA